MDAKRGEVYWGLYRCPADQPLVEADPVRLPLAELYRRLTPPLILNGPWVSSLEGLPEGVALAAPESRQPRAATVARLARRRLEVGLAARPNNWRPLPAAGRPCDPQGRLPLISTSPPRPKDG